MECSPAVLVEDEGPGFLDWSRSTISTRRKMEDTTSKERLD
jgi:hypothetical protein